MTLKRQENGATFELTMKGDGFYDVFYTLDLLLDDDTAPYSLLVDTGSSDMWIASSSCSSSACKGAPRLWNPASAQLSPAAQFSMDYLAGKVSGPVYWDKVQLGDYVIPHQAIAAANSVENESLSSGFSGILGLALPPNSKIYAALPAGLGDQPDGATFSSNLFGLDTAPSQRFLAISLSRPGFDNLDKSPNAWPARLSFGKHIDEVVQANGGPGAFESKIDWVKMVASSDGYLHWSSLLLALTTWKDGISTQVPLGRSQVQGGGVYPIAVLDTGGQNMVATRSLCNAVYGAYNINPASDGQYYVPCNVPLNMTITLGSVAIPLHPLDMSNPPNNDPTASNCLGSLQASDSIASKGFDIVLGISFLRNAYIIHSYPNKTDDPVRRAPGDTPPRFGVIGLTDISAALTEFNNVRISNLSPDGSPIIHHGDDIVGDDVGMASGTIVKIVLGVVFFILFVLCLFAARWLVLRRKFQRKGIIGPKVGEESLPMRTWEKLSSGQEHPNLRPLSIRAGQRDKPKGIFGAPFGVATFFGAGRNRRAYQRTDSDSTLVHDTRRRRSGELTEDDKRRLKFEEYLQRKNASSSMIGRETSVWSETGTLYAPPSGKLDGVYGPLDDFGMPKGEREAADNSSDEVTARAGSSRHGSVKGKGSVELQNWDPTMIASSSTTPPVNTTSISAFPFSTPDATSMSSLQAFPVVNLPQLQINQSHSVHPPRGRVALAVEPSLSPLTEVTSTEGISLHLPSPLSRNSTVSVREGTRSSLMSSALLSIGEGEPVGAWDSASAEGVPVPRFASPPPTIIHPSASPSFPPLPPKVEEQAPRRSRMDDLGLSIESNEDSRFPKMTHARAASHGNIGLKVDTVARPVPMKKGSQDDSSLPDRAVDAREAHSTSKRPSMGANNSSSGSIPKFRPFDEFGWLEGRGGDSRFPTFGATAPVGKRIRGSTSASEMRNNLSTGASLPSSRPSPTKHSFSQNVVASGPSQARPPMPRARASEPAIRSSVGSSQIQNQSVGRAGELPIAVSSKTTSSSQAPSTRATGSSGAPSSSRPTPSTATASSYSSYKFPWDHVMTPPVNMDSPIGMPGTPSSANDRVSSRSTTSSNQSLPPGAALPKDPHHIRRLPSVPVSLSTTPSPLGHYPPSSLPPHGPDRATPPRRSIPTPLVLREADSSSLFSSTNPFRPNTASTTSEFDIGNPDDTDVTVESGFNAARGVEVQRASDIPRYSLEQRAVVEDAHIEPDSYFPPSRP